MKKVITLLLTLLCIAIVVGAVAVSLFGGTDVLSPAGTIAQQQRELIIVATLMMLVVVIPVFLMTWVIATKYRESKNAEYKPTWDGSRFAETLWWGIPLVLIAVLSVIIVKSSHELDPYKPLASDKQPIEVQVIALQWKWLFIYPEQRIASVNYLQIPEDTPINFKITSDAPMNSFWIPKLGGQVYAMAGMTTKLHLQADEPGEYQGSSANISGEGFADMNFTTRASSRADFDAWVLGRKSVGDILDVAAYDALAAPTTKGVTRQYVLLDTSLFNTVQAKYMPPASPVMTHDKENH